ncbi:MAG: ATP-binding cassette domain-containing protein [Leptospira sp.]|nr:ATP-binding cassette domain-containing protein [Leptospira sp.]
MGSTLRNLIPYLKPYRIHIILAGFALIFTSLATLSLGQGLRLLVDLGFSSDKNTSDIYTSDSLESNSFMLEILPFTVGDLSSYEKLSLAIAFLLFLGIIMGAGTFIRHYLVSWIGERVSSDLRKSVYQHVIHMEPAFFEENSAGEIQSRILTDTTILQTVVGSSFSIFLRNALIFILGMAWLFITNPKLTSIVMLSVPLVVFPILIFGKKVRKLSKETQDKLAGVGSHVNESLLNIRTVQAFHHQNLELEKMNLIVEGSFSVAAKRILYRSYMILIVIVLILLGISFMIWTGGKDVLDGTITPGELVAFSFYAVMVASALASVSEVIGDLQRAAGATERLIDLLSLEPKIKDPTNPIEIPKSENYYLTFSNVRFFYNTRKDKPALDGLNLILPAGKVTALVGPSGAGKSTLFDLIFRFHELSVGSISINGINIKDITLSDLRKHLGLVPQQPSMFSGTIQENIIYGKPTATEEEMIHAAQAAHCYDFIQELPNGFNSLVGENGVRLSGGQKQRIAIARAILKNPPILLLDEATSALDAESEHHIQKALLALTKDRTTLMIAHRLSTVIRADKIFVLDKGKVVGEGTHSELLKSNELYANLARLQFIES